MAWLQYFVSIISFTSYALTSLDCNYVAFPEWCRPYNTEYCRTDKDAAILPLDVCFTYWEDSDSIPASYILSCNNNKVVAAVSWDSVNCEEPPTWTFDVSSSDYKCNSLYDCIYFIQDTYFVPSYTSCVDGVIPSDIIPSKFIFVTDYCLSFSYTDNGGIERILSFFQSSCDAYGESTFFAYSGTRCDDESKVLWNESYPSGTCVNDTDGSDFKLDLGCFQNNEPTTADPTSTPIEPTSTPIEPASTPTDQAASDDDSDVIDINITILYDVSDAVINHVTLSIEEYVSSLSVDIDYMLDTVDDIIMIQFYGTESDLSYVDEEEVIAFIQADLDAFDEQNSSDTKNEDAKESSSLDQIAFIIMIMLVIFTLVAFIYAKKIKPNDYFQIGPLFSASLQILDCISDILFAVNITEDPQYALESKLFILFILSIIFILLPVFTSVLQLKTIIIKHWKKNDQMRAWLRDHIYYLFILSMICGSSFAAIKLCSCNAFNLKFLSIPLTKTDKSHFQYKRLYSVVLLENLPQLAIALCFAIITSGADDIVYISMAFSAMSIIMMVVSSLATKEIIESQDSSLLVLHVTGSMFMENTKKCQNITNKIKDNLSILLGVDHALIEIPKPQCIHRGLRLEVFLIMNHDTIIELQIEKKIYDSETKQIIADFITSCWKLDKKPTVEIIKFEQNQSKQRRTMDVTSGIKTNTEKTVHLSAEMTETKKGVASDSSANGKDDDIINTEKSTTPNDLQSSA